MLRKILVVACLGASVSIANAGDMVTLSGGQGAYVAGSENAKAAVVIVHDWFGLTDATKAEAERLAAVGYRVAAVDLYSGKSASDHAAAETLMKALDPAAAQSAVKAGIDHVATEGRKAVVEGFSMGGRIALEAALSNSGKALGAVLVYGGDYDSLPATLLSKPLPILVIAGSKDEWSYPSLLKIQDQLKDTAAPVESYVYPGAAHAFAQPLFNEGKNADAKATAAAHAVINSFLSRNLPL
jgi:carboxymethylenebutenolidase